MSLPSLSMDGMFLNFYSLLRRFVGVRSRLTNQPAKSSKLNMSRLDEKGRDHDTLRGMNEAGNSAGFTGCQLRLEQI